MTIVTIFVIGVVVTLLTAAAVVMVGISEASDPDQVRAEDLPPWERSLAQREDRSRRDSLPTRDRTG